MLEDADVPESPEDGPKSTEACRQESLKLEAETRKLITEDLKLRAEIRHLRIAPFVNLGSSLVAVFGVVTGLVVAFHSLDNTEATRKLNEAHAIKAENDTFTQTQLLEEARKQNEAAAVKLRAAEELKSKAERLELRHLSNAQQIQNENEDKLT